MKAKLLTSLAFIILDSTFLILNCNATVRTVTNDPTGGAQFATADAAFTASVNGDTILLEGTNTTYVFNGAFNKKMVIIGIGLNPTVPNPRLTNITLNGGFNTGANGSRFYGVTIVNTFSTGSNTSDLRFENCAFSGYPTITGGNDAIIFTNCIFTAVNTTNFYVNGTQSTNILLQSCVFNGHLNGGGYITSTISVDHCMFLGTTTAILYLANNYQFTNCIFMNEANISNGANSINNEFDYCIFRLMSALPPSCTGNNNQFLTDPLFTTYTNGAAYSSTANFKLQASSTGLGTGSSGSDIGIYGSPTHFSNTGEVLINPMMRSLFIQNINIAPNGNLNVNINATKPTDH